MNGRKQTGSPLRQSTRRLGLLLAGLSVALLIGIFHNFILTSIASFMTIGDPIEKADLILPLYHERHTIPFAAASLYHRRYADRVVLIRTRPSRLESLSLVPAPHEVWRGALEAERVPPEAIITIGPHVENNLDLARAVVAFLGSHRKSRIIVVASAPLSRISRYDLRRWLAGSSIEVRMYPVSPREFDEKTWWRSRHGWITYFDAYFLLALRLVRD